MHGKTWHAHELEDLDLILLGRQYYPKGSTDLMQLVSKIQHFLQKWKIHPKIQMEFQGTLNKHYFESLFVSLFFGHAMQHVVS